MGTVTLAAPCAGQRHDLTRASEQELIIGLLRCGCFVDGLAAARVLNARRVLNPGTAVRVLR